MEADGDWVFSFENICEALGFNPAYVRKGLLRWMIGLERKGRWASHPEKKRNNKQIQNGRDGNLFIRWVCITKFKGANRVGRIQRISRRW